VEDEGRAFAATRNKTQALARYFSRYCSERRASACV
jgi:hypothetical protein